MLSSESGDILTDSLAQFGGEVWPIITSKAPMVASVDVKGLQQIVARKFLCKC